MSVPRFPALALLIDLLGRIPAKNRWPGRPTNMIATGRLLLWIGLLVGTVLVLNGCSMVERNSQSKSASGVTQEILPVREVGVVVVSQDLRSVSTIQELINQTSQRLLEEVGIRLYIQDWRLINWHTTSRDGRLNQLVTTMREYDRPYDIAIAFCNRDLVETLGYMTVGGWQGVIDNTFRRFIVVRTHDIKILLHEIVHVFVFDTEHSGGVMTGTDICLFPNFLCLGRTQSMRPWVREEMIQNKWRDFSMTLSQARISGRQ